MELKVCSAPRSNTNAMLKDPYQHTRSVHMKSALGHHTVTYLILQSHLDKISIQCKYLLCKHNSCTRQMA